MQLWRLRLRQPSVLLALGAILFTLPGHVLANMNTKIFGTVHRFKNMSVL